MEARVVLITGATDGIGKLTALLIAKLGATVLIHGRNPQRVQTALTEIQKESGNANIHGYVADFSSLEAVRQLSRDVHNNFASLDVLINNAGVFEVERSVSKDGYERTFAVNVLAPFLLASEVIDLLKKGKKPQIVNVASISHASSIDFNNLQFLTKYGNGLAAYEQSKLFDIMFTYTMAAKFSPSHITVNCLDPGTVNTKMLLNSHWGPIGIDVEDAVYEFDLATNRKYENTTGIYLLKDRESKSAGVSYDKGLQQKLWDILVEMTGATFL